MSKAQGRGATLPPERIAHVRHVVEVNLDMPNTDLARRLKVDHRVVARIRAEVLAAKVAGQGVAA